MIDDHFSCNFVTLNSAIVRYTMIDLLFNLVALLFSEVPPEIVLDSSHRIGIFQDEKVLPFCTGSAGPVTLAFMAL
jgi:hypothetical protein